MEGKRVLSRITLLSGLLHSLLAGASAEVVRYANTSSVRAVTTTNNLTILVGTGLSSALACNSAKWKWSSGEATKTAEVSVESRKTFTSTHPDVSLEVNVYTATQTFVSNSTPYTLCDGFPRLNGSTATSTWEKTTPHTSLDPVLTVQTFSAVETLTPVPSPSCIIAPSDCSALNELWSSSSSSWASAHSSYIVADKAVSYTGSPPPALSWGSPLCGQVQVAKTESATVIAGAPLCFIPEASVELLYWPVTTVSGDLCNKSGSTLTMSPTIPGRPNTYTTLNRTLTSPTVYIQLNGRWGYTSDGTTFANQTRMLLAQSSASVSSYCANNNITYDTPLPIDYANFNYPVPASAYRCQPKCFSPSSSSWKTVSTVTNGYYNGSQLLSAYTITETVYAYSTYPSENLCSTIWNDYAPALVVPPELLSISLVTEIGGGGFCKFNVDENNVFFDPPKALTHVTSAAGPFSPGGSAAATTTTQTPTVSAEPAGSVNDPIVASTSEPVAGSSTTSPTAEIGPRPYSTTLPLSSVSVWAKVSDPAVPAAETSNGIASVIASVMGMTDRSTAGTIADQGSPAISGESASTQQISAQDPAPAAVDPASAVVSLLGSEGATGAPATDAVDPSAGAYFSSKPPSLTAALPALVWTASDGSDRSFPAITSYDPTMSSAAPVIGLVLTGDAGGGEHTFTVNSADGLVIGSVTVSYGETRSVSGIGNIVAATAGVGLSSMTIAYSVLGTRPTSTNVRAAAPIGVVLTGAGDNAHTFSVNHDGGLVLGSATVPYGQTTSVSGMGYVVAGPSGIAFSDTTVAYSALETQRSDDSLASALAVAGVTSTADGTGPISLASGIVLLPGGPAVTIGGETMSLATSGSFLVIDGSSTVSRNPASTPTTEPVITFDGHTYTADSAALFSLGPGTVLTPGSAVTIFGSTLSLGADASYIVVNGATKTLSTISSGNETLARATQDPTASSDSAQTPTGGSGFSGGNGAQGTAVSSAERSDVSSCLMVVLLGWLVTFIYR